jgi:hypothetical protein
VCVCTRIHVLHALIWLSYLYLFLYMRRQMRTNPRVLPVVIYIIDGLWNVSVNRIMRLSHKESMPSWMIYLLRHCNFVTLSFGDLPVNLRSLVRHPPPKKKKFRHTIAVTFPVQVIVILVIPFYSMDCNLF